MNEARKKFGARTKREAAKTARRIVEQLIQSYFEVGQPHDQAIEDEVPEADADRLRDALERIRERYL